MRKWHWGRNGTSVMPSRNFPLTCHPVTEAGCVCRPPHWHFCTPLLLWDAYNNPNNRETFSVCWLPVSLGNLPLNFCGLLDIHFNSSEIFFSLQSLEWIKRNHPVSLESTRRETGFGRLSEEDGRALTYPERYWLTPWTVLPTAQWRCSWSPGARHHPLWASQFVPVFSAASGKPIYTLPPPRSFMRGAWMLLQLQTKQNKTKPCLLRQHTDKNWNDRED